MADPRTDPRGDEELVAAGNRGEAGALEALYFRYRDWAASLAYRFTGDREAARDVVQEAFAYLFAKFPGFRLRARLTTMLYPAVRNTALAMRRKRRPEGVEEGFAAFADPEALGPGAGSMVGGGSVARGGAGIGEAVREGRAAMAAAVGRLPDAQREVLLMRAVDDMSIAEIALALGVPEGTVKSRLHHALAAMRADPGARRYFAD